MGMYTELFICTRLKNSSGTIEILKYMQRGGTGEVPHTPDHPLFKTDRWPYMLRCNSYYFTPACVNLLEYDAIGENWSFINRSDLKNYDQEIEKFWDWLLLYVDTSPGEMVGYTRYEEDREPTVVYS